MASDQPGTTILGRPKPPGETQKVAAGTEAAPPAGVTTNIATDIPSGRAKRSSTLEFRGFDFFANRDFNELRNASRAYFAPAAGAEKHQGLPPTWLGDATPPASPRPSSEWPPVRENKPPAPPGGPAPPNEKNIFGLRRRQFWWVVALIALLLVVAIAVGVGVGVGRASHNSSEAAAVSASSLPSTGTTSAMSGSSTPVATSTVTASTSDPSRTTTSSTPTPTGDAGAKIDCPAANGTTYQVPGSNKSFLRICGIDYNSNEAENLRQVPTESILDCMKNCAGTAGCTGCGWGYLQGDTGTQHTCWLKGDLKKSHEVDMNWAFAVLL